MKKRYFNNYINKTTSNKKLKNIIFIYNEKDKKVDIIQKSNNDILINEKNYIENFLQIKNLNDLDKFIKLNEQSIVFKKFIISLYLNNNSKDIIKNISPIVSILHSLTNINITEIYTKIKSFKKDIIKNIIKEYLE